MQQSLQRPPLSAQLTPPSANNSFPCANSSHSSTVVWPSLFGVLETPERKRAAAFANSSQPSVTNAANCNNPAQQMLWHDSSTTTHELNLNEDSGLGDSFLDLSNHETETSMILRPSPVLRTPFVTNTKNLQSPLRSFFFKPSPPTQNNQPSSLSKSENAIGVRFNGTNLVHLKSPCLLSSIQNQNAPPTFSDQHLSSQKKPYGQRSPLKPCQTSSRNLTADLNAFKKSNVETPSKGVKLETYTFDGLSPFVSPLKFSQSFYNDSFGNEQTNSFMDPASVDMFDHYFGNSNSLDATSNSLTSFHTSPTKSLSLKNETLSSFSLSLNSTNESFLSANSSLLDQPGSMSCSKAVRIKVPRFSSRTKNLIYGRTQAQHDITKQANNFWKRNCGPNYETGIPLCKTLQEFEQINWNVKQKESRLQKSRNL